VVEEEEAGEGEVVEEEEGEAAEKGMGLRMDSCRRWLWRLLYL
jgi:hypothetical protein